MSFSECLYLDQIFDINVKYDAKLTSVISIRWSPKFERARGLMVSLLCQENN